MIRCGFFCRAVLLAGLTFDALEDALAGYVFTSSDHFLHETKGERKVSLSPDLNCAIGADLRLNHELNQRQGLCEMALNSADKHLGVDNCRPALCLNKLYDNFILGVGLFRHKRVKGEADDCIKSA